MSLRKTILVIDDNIINRILLKKILSDRYEILEAANGQEGLDVLLSAQDRIAAVLLDVIMPVMDGYTFLTTVRKLPEFLALPIVVMTHSEDNQTEITALEKGATDFITKPYQSEILKQRINNILLLSEAAALKNTAERDRLTGLYNKETFYAKATEYLLSSDAPCEIICVDIEHFKLINDLFGSAQGDRLLQFIAGEIKNATADFGLCARLEADHFAVCTPYSPQIEAKLIDIAETGITNYPLDMKISLRLGIYPVDDPHVPVNLMCDRANLAIETIKGKFHEPCVVYDDSHRRILLEEQEIVNTMHTALQEQQFEAYYQPKLDLFTLRIIGAEALVRWKHPHMGMIPPGKFIPIFEKNGFISAMDEYIWELVCAQIRSWIDQGKPVVPISVNVSRVDIFNPNLCAILTGLVRKYAIPHGMLRLEVTETAYRENPEQPIRAVRQLREAGFFVEMDDFGSGYSSLNVLKDIPVDTLKIDLRFLENTENTARGANILASVVRMAKWLNLPVTAEGVEKQEQIEFLRSIGCDSAQGYYFSKPVPVADFEKLLGESPVVDPPCTSPRLAQFEGLWEASHEFNLLFNNVIGAVGIFELDGDHLELIRANEAYFELGEAFSKPFHNKTISALDTVVLQDRAAVMDCFYRAVHSQRVESVLYRHAEKETFLWLKARLCCLYTNGKRSLFYCSITDVTSIRQLETALTVMKEKCARLEEDFARTLACHSKKRT